MAEKMTEDQEVLDFKWTVRGWILIELDTGLSDITIPDFIDQIRKITDVERDRGNFQIVRADEIEYVVESNGECEVLAKETNKIHLVLPVEAVDFDKYCSATTQIINLSGVTFLKNLKVVAHHPGNSPMTFGSFRPEGQNAWG